MLLRISKINDSSKAAAYHGKEQQDERGYYASAVDAGGSSQWMGKGAAALIAEGKLREGDNPNDRVRLQDFRGVLEGRAEIFGRQVGLSPEKGLENTQKNEALRAEYRQAVREWKAGGQDGPKPEAPKYHRERASGFDFTFNVPKSVSLMAAPGYGDDAKVREALDATYARIIDRIEAQIQDRLGAKTGNIVAAVYKEDAARPVVRSHRGDGMERFDGKAIPDPHSHAHVVIANVTRGADGKWRALDAEKFFERSGGEKTWKQKLEKEASEILRYELATRGFKVEWREEKGRRIPEIAGVPKEAMDQASTRSSQIEDRKASMEARGREIDSTADVEANKSTRLGKGAADRPTTLEYWRAVGARFQEQFQAVSDAAKALREAQPGHDQAQQPAPAAAPSSGAEQEAKAADQDRPRQETATPVGEGQQPAESAPSAPVEHRQETATPVGQGQQPAESAPSAPVENRQEPSAPAPGSLAEKVDRDAMDAARKGIDYATAHLSEGSSVFPHAEMVTRAERWIRQNAKEAAVTSLHIERVLQAKEAGGDLERRTTLAYNPKEKEFQEVPAWTTRQAIETENRFLARLDAGKGAVVPILSREDAASAVDLADARAQERNPAYAFNEGHRTAAIGILTSEDRFIGLQGFAGTAKTNAVLSTVAHEAREHGMEVRLIAPTGSAAKTLADALKMEGATLVRTLHELDKESKAAGAEPHPGGFSPSLWIVDESSMASTAQLERLSAYAEERGARILFTGDVLQHASVEAGRGFSQAQEKMQTFYLDTIVRQENEQLRTAVYHAIRGDIGEALSAIDRGGGKIHEIEKADKRYDAMAQDYLATPKEERGRVLVIEASRDGRDELNQKIREGLRAEGTLKKKEVQAETLVDRRLTTAEARYAVNYKLGDVIRFGRTSARHGIARGQTLTVVGHNQDGTLRLEKAKGQEISWNPIAASKMNAKAYGVEKRGISAGDRILWTFNDRRAGRINSQEARVERVDSRRMTADVKLENGTVQKLNLRNRDDQHWNHAYAITSHAAQGRTASRVIANMESWRVNLMNKRSVYVILSRAQNSVTVYTDKRGKLMSDVQERSGGKQAALDRGPTDYDQAHAGRATTSMERRPGVARQVAQRLDHVPQQAPTRARNSQVRSSVARQVVQRMDTTKEAKPQTVTRSTRVRSGVARQVAQRLDHVPQQAPTRARNSQVRSSVARQVAERINHSQQTQKAQAGAMRLSGWVRSGVARQVVQRMEKVQQQPRAQAPAQARQGYPQHLPDAIRQPTARPVRDLGTINIRGRELARAGFHGQPAPPKERKVRTLAIRTNSQGPNGREQSRSMGAQRPPKSMGRRFAEYMHKDLSRQPDLWHGRDVEKDVHRAVDRLQRDIERLGDRLLAAAFRKITQGMSAAGNAAGRAMEHGFTKMVQSRTLGAIGGKVDRAITTTGTKVAEKVKTAVRDRVARADAKAQAAEHKADNLLSKGASQAQHQSHTR